MVSPEAAEFAVVSRPGEPGDLDLDHGTFPFAGRFGRRSTGTAVLRLEGGVVAALAFSPDRRAPSVCRVRYLAVRRDRQGAGFGPALLDRFTAWALASYTRVKIGADTPQAAVAYERAGFRFTGERGPRGEVVYGYPATAGSTLTPALTALLAGELPAEQRRYALERLASAGDDDRPS